MQERTPEPLEYVSGPTPMFLSPDSLRSLKPELLGFYLTGDVEDAAYVLPPEAYERGVVNVPLMDPLTGTAYSTEKRARIRAHELVHADRWHRGCWSARNFSSSWLAILIDEYVAYRTGTRRSRTQAMVCALRSLSAWVLAWPMMVDPYER